MYKEEKNKIEAFLSIFDNSVYNQISPPYIKILLQQLCFILRLQTKHDEK